MKDKSKKSVYEIVTQSIIEKLESGVAPWKKPWKGGSHGEPRAYYSPSKDLVMMPEIGFFKTSEGYHCTLFHELTHSTGHTARLNRDGITAANARFGSEVYSKEELVAELGAAFLCASCGIETQEEQNAAYIEGWLKALKSDSKLIFQAASAAQKAADLILDINPVDYGSEKKIKKKGKSKNVA